MVRIPSAGLIMDDGCNDVNTDLDCEPKQPKRAKVEDTPERLMQTLHNGNRIGTSLIF